MASERPIGLLASTRATHPSRRSRPLLLPLAVTCALFGSVTLLGSRHAHAQDKTEEDDKKTESVKIGVYVEGFSSNKIKKELLEILPPEFEVVEDFTFKREMLRNQAKLPVGIILTLKDKRTRFVDGTRKALEKLDAKAAVIGTVRPAKGGGMEVYFLIVPREGDPTFDGPVKVGNGDNSAALGGSLGPPLIDMLPTEEVVEEVVEEKEEPKEEEEPEEEEEEEEEEDDGEERIPFQFGSQIFWIGANFELAGRDFTYNDPVTDNLRDYSIFAPPAFLIEGGVYPLAESDIPIAKDLGVIGYYGQSFALDSETEDGSQVDTSWNRFGVGLRFRLPIGREDPVVLGLSGGFSKMKFNFTTDDETLAAEVPNVDYSAIFVGLDGRVPIGPIAIALMLKYQGAVDAGETKDRFTDPSIGGLVFGGGVNVPLISGLEARVGVEYDRWFYAFKPEVGDEFVAGGALDQTIHMRAGLAFAY